MIQYLDVLDFSIYLPLIISAQYMHNDNLFHKFLEVFDVLLVHHFYSKGFSCDTTNAEIYSSRTAITKNTVVNYVIFFRKLALDK